MGKVVLVLAAIVSGSLRNVVVRVTVTETAVVFAVVVDVVDVMVVLVVVVVLGCK